MFNIIYKKNIYNMNILANIIAFLHLLFIIFITTTPFVTDNPFMLLYYCFILFFVMVHWYLNNDTCVLTLLEAKLRGKKDNDTFMGRLIKPIYNISSKEIHYLGIILFLYAFLKIRIWEKERYHIIYRTIYVKYKLIYNKLNNIKLDKDINNEILSYKLFSLYHILDFFSNPLQESTNENINELSNQNTSVNELTEQNVNRLTEQNTGVNELTEQNVNELSNQNTNVDELIEQNVNELSEQNINQVEK